MLVVVALVGVGLFQLPLPGGRVLVSGPPTDTGLDYQLGGAYQPPAGAGIVVRDRNAAPAGEYPVCYVNGFQAQPDELSWWTKEHPDLLLRDSAGKTVIDADWNEALFDVSTPAKRSALLAVQRDWLAGCAKAGFKAVDFDNLDSNTRSNGKLTAEHNLAYARAAIAEAHKLGLAMGQKNMGSELGKQGRAIGFDFAIAEDCAQYDECDSYVQAFGRAVLQIEYTDSPIAGFTESCRRWGSGASSHPIVRRDRDLTVPGQQGYYRKTC